jgi:2-oxo-4-hydroxy-4-carboxy-5-ureidoimidazoline decarboxylase
MKNSMADAVTIEQINSASRNEFVERLGWIFEHSPWVAERCWEHRPYKSLEELHRRMVSEVEQAAVHERLALLRAHPDLGSRAKVSAASVNEQAGAGLDRLTPEEHQRLLKSNEAYKTKFGFPFLYAVKGSDKFAIMQALERRLNETPELEFEEALRQVCRIARFRLEDVIDDGRGSK